MEKSIFWHENQGRDAESPLTQDALDQPEEKRKGLRTIARAIYSQRELPRRDH